MLAHRVEESQQREALSWNEGGSRLGHGAGGGACAALTRGRKDELLYETIKSKSTSSS